VPLTEAQKRAKAKYRASEKGKAAERAYKQSDKYRAWAKEYRRRPEVATLASERQREKQKTQPEYFREASLRYLRTENGSAKRKSYATSDQNKAAQARYRATENGKAAAKRSVKNYQATEHGYAVVLANVWKRRARKRAAPGNFTGADARKLFVAQEGFCAACYASIIDGYHVDHIMPLSRGGSNWPDNLQLLCPPCNHSKGAKTMSEWRGKQNGCSV
jgi:5-methylcytosine-specific restriction endonuclease McrA